MKLGFALLFSGCFFLLCTSPVGAHAFGQLYNLPVPFWMYLYGGAAAVILSFVIISFFVREQKGGIGFPSIVLPKWSLLLTHPFVLSFFKIAALFLLILTIISGLVGNNDIYSNFNMTFFWIIFLLGVMYTIGLLGNYWDSLNPLRIIASLSARLFGDGLLPYPKKARYFPAIFFYVALIWIELFYPVTPLSLSLILIQYIFVTAFFSVIFGVKQWFYYAEFFSVFFRIIGMMGIVERRQKGFSLRLPFVGVLDRSADHISLLFFIIFMLSSTAYDGISSTVFWSDTFQTPFAVSLLPFFTDASAMVTQSVGLLIMFVFFLFIFILCIFLAKHIAQNTKKLSDLLLKFVFSLVPIAFVYNIAHYFTLLFTESQNMIRIISDPFGMGWNLFGTKSDAPILLPDANFVWHTQVGILLLGHIAGVYLAHVIAIQVFQGRKKVLLSQLPLLLIMVIYTVVGLWILSQPIAPGQ